MKKIFLVKKDPANEGQDNWIMMNGYEFAMFMKTPEGQARKGNFGQLDACSEDDSIIVMECGAETAKAWRSEKDMHDYLREQEKETGFVTISYSAIYSEDGEISGEDMIRDTECSVEEEAIKNIEEQRLLAAIESLSEYEKAIVYAFYLTKTPTTEKKFGALHGFSQQLVHYHKDCVLLKLKKIMG